MGASIHLDLFLVRHGITDWNQEKRYLGHTDRPVIKNELHQLAEVKKEVEKHDFDSIFTSDLRRCKETLEYLNIPAPFAIDSRLREIDFGDWEGKTYHDLKDVKAYRDWIDDWETGSIPNGENAYIFKSRIDSFLHDLFRQKMEHPSNGKERILLMTHGGVIRYIVSKYVASKTFWEFSISHGQGVLLTMQYKEKWKCNSLLVVPSLEKEK